MTMRDMGSAMVVPEGDGRKVPLSIWAAGWAGAIFGVLALVRALAFAAFGEIGLAAVACVAILMAGVLLAGSVWGYAGSILLATGAAVASVVLMVTSEKGLALGVSLGVSLGILVLLGLPTSRAWARAEVATWRERRAAAAA